MTAQIGETLRSMERGTKLLIAGAAVLLLTIAHHFYGAWLYATPWRHHVAVVAVPVFLLLFALHALHRRHAATRVGIAAGYTFATITALIPVGLIGLFEGGYSHLLKNVVYFGGVRGASFDRSFPRRPTRFQTTSCSNRAAFCKSSLAAMRPLRSLSSGASCDSGKMLRVRSRALECRPVKPIARH